MLRSLLSTAWPPLLGLALMTWACQDPVPSGGADLASADPPGADLTAVPQDLAVAPDLGAADPLAGIGVVEKVMGGFQFTEGPYWFADRGVLLFSDIQGNRIIELTPPSALRTFRMPSGMSNGLGRDEKGRLLACEHANRRLSRTEADGSITTLAERWEGKRLSSPNDVIARADGTLYFSDPPYGIPAGQTQELPFQGVFRLDPAGKMYLVDDSLNRPNGVALSPDQRVLYVADTTTGKIKKYAIGADGATQQMGELGSTGGGGDGIAIDDAGNLYVAASAGVRVFSPAGKDFGTIKVAEIPANVGFGDADRRTLYITARTSLYRVRLVIPGLP